jgi:hypothetical protein
VKHTKSKASRGIVTRVIVYRDRRRPHDRPRQLKVDVSRGEVLDSNYAAAMVTLRTPLPLADVEIVKIGEEPDSSVVKR